MYKSGHSFSLGRPGTFFGSWGKPQKGAPYIVRGNIKTCHFLACAAQLLFWELGEAPKRSSPVLHTYIHTYIVIRLVLGAVQVVLGVVWVLLLVVRAVMGVVRVVR